MQAKDRIILALDVPSEGEAVRLAERLKDRVGAFKVGLELVNAAGPCVFDALRKVGADRIFYDAKLHDIPNTVAAAARAAARHGLWMVNVHASGGARMMAAAASGLHNAVDSAAPPLLIAVTLLTSLTAEELASEMRVSMPPAEYVTSLARMAQDSGAQGVVASPHEITAIRAACGRDFIIVTPGVRPAGADQGDQRRTMTPGEAISLGADYLVIGRPITSAPNPVEAARHIAAEIEGAQPPSAA